MIFLKHLLTKNRSCSPPKWFLSMETTYISQETILVIISFWLGLEIPNLWNSETSNHEVITELIAYMCYHNAMCSYLLETTPWAA